MTEKNPMVIMLIAMITIMVMVVIVTMIMTKMTLKTNNYCEFLVKNCHFRDYHLVKRTKKFGHG